MYLTQSLHRNLQQRAEETATIDGPRRRTWLELHDRVARLAGGLLALGLEPGDRVAILARNGDYFLENVFGALWAGGVINPLNYRWSPAELLYALRDSETKVLIADPALVSLGEIRQQLPSLEMIALGAGAEDALDFEAWLAAAEPALDTLRHDQNLAALLYTGGTTGFPKGVMLSHHNLISSAAGLIATEGGRCGSRYLHCAPLFHVGGFSGMLLAMLSGSTHVLMPAFEPLEALELIAREQVTDFFMVPTMIRMLLDHPRLEGFDVSHVRTIRYGAAAIDDALLDRAIAAFPKAAFAQAYGMTELSPVCAVLEPSDHSMDARRQGRGRSAGRATPMTEVRIVDAADHEVPRGQIGEICARGGNVMMGYWNLPLETAQALRGGWMHTGDMGWMDDAGYITVVDRLKDMIITGGENVYSAEVENALSSHPAVAHAAVIGTPHETWGEQVHAVVVLRPGFSPDIPGLQAHVRAQIAAYKTPRAFSFADTLPVSAAGKVLKNVLREQFRGDSAAV